MNVKRRAIFLAAPLAAAVIAPCSLTAFAADSYFEGKEVRGAVCVNDSSVILEEKALTLNVPDLPSDFAKEAFDGYEASAKTEYTFYNPTEEDEDLTMLFPVGQRPAYCGVDDSARYLVTVDGKQVDYTVRHSYCGSTYDFDWTPLVDRQAEEGFYRRDMPVTEYVFTVTVPEEEGNYHKLTLEFECDSQKTRVFGKDRPLFAAEDGKNTVNYLIRTTGTYEAHFFAIGDSVTFLSPSLTKWNREEGERQSAGTVEEPVATEGTFLDLVDYQAGLGVSEQDWFNAYVDMLNENTYNDLWVFPIRLSKENLLCWYEYSLHIPAGERVVNAVQSPLYPSFTQTASPQYEYSYLLSLSQRFRDCKKFKIRINTPYYLYWSSLEFERDEGGYVFERNSLPQSELNFVITRTELMAGGAVTGTDNFLKPSVSAALLVLIIVISAAVVVTVAVIVVMTRLKKAVRERDEATSFPKRNDQDK